MSPIYGQGFIVNHNAVRAFDEIPEYWLGQAKQLKFHYGHTSHGAQLTVGLDRIDNIYSGFEFLLGKGYVPASQDAFCLFDGTYVNGSYDEAVQPEDYWEGEQGRNCTRFVLNNYQNINVSMFMWCWQMRSVNISYVEEYLAAMEQLEQEYPDITFIYATGHSQTYTGHHYYGHLGNGYLPINQRNNDRIRQYCRNNNKILFDFGDIDNWWYNADLDQWTCGYSSHDGVDYPREHDHYNIDEAGHTSFENCENKGKAVWYMLARIAGWDGVVSAIDDPVQAVNQFSLSQNYPNPFNPSTKIEFNLATSEKVSIEVFDILGQSIKTLVNRKMDAGSHTIEFNASNLPSGVYIYQINAGDFSARKKMMLVK
jgi:hypothetical protein